MTALADDLVPDELWALVAPLLPAPPRPPYGGRHRTIPDRACLAAIVFMTRTSTPWRLLPARELGCGSPATCWRRLTEWVNAGVFDQLHLQVLDRLGEQGELDWSRASVDSMSVRAKRGGPCGRKSGRSWQAWNQAPPGLRRQRAAADRGGDRRQRQRHHHVPGGRGRRAASPQPLGTAPHPARQAPRSQGVRQPREPGVPAAAWDHRADRSAWDRVPDTAGTPSLAGGAVAVVVGLLQAAAGAVGPGQWAVVRVCAAGMCAGVLQPAGIS